MITAIINVYKRPKSYLIEQIEALKQQTVPPSDIWVWHNRPEGGEFMEGIEELGVKVIYSTHNFKFHGRFAAALLARTKYVAIFDDDTIPGVRWFENCLDTIKAGYDGILGTTGVCIDGDTTYVPAHKYGWNGFRVDRVVEVDLVGHAWFLNKNYLRYLWYQDPLIWQTGEDIQLSHFAQKHGNIRTYVPPHPENDTTLWGSHPQKGMQYGTDQYGASVGEEGNTSLHYRNECVRKCVEDGWELVKHRR